MNILSHSTYSPFSFVDLELEFPCHGADRMKEPLFADDDHLPFTRWQLDNSLNTMLQSFLPADKVGNYSWHSMRVTAACLLDSVNVPPDKIKRMLRWISDESLRTYVRPGNYEFAEYMDKMVHGTVDNTQTRNLPDFQHVRHMQALVLGGNME